MHRHLEAALQDGAGLILRREHPELGEAIRRAVRSGDLTRVLNGVYLATGLAGQLEHRVRALVRYDPDAVVTGEAAARLTWWPELTVPGIAAYRQQSCNPAPGFRWTRSRPDPVLVSGHLAVPALQVLDLIPLIGPRVVDESLRRRATSLRQLNDALVLTAARVGNVLRRQVLIDSRDEPWSEAEREFHQVLRTAGITGWRTNYPVLVDGATYLLDVALPALLLAFEVDGFTYHGTRAAFEGDRFRDCALAGHGWQVVRLSAAQVPTCARLVRAVIATRATHLGAPH